MLEYIIVVAGVCYWTVTVMLGTSIGLRMGYHPFRKLVVAPVWPLLAIKRVNEWAKYDPDAPPKCVEGYLNMVDDRVNTDA